MSLFKQITCTVALMGLLVPHTAYAADVTDFQVSVSTDQEIYEIGDNVEITMQAENHTLADVFLHFTTGCQMGVEVFKYDELIYSEDMYPRNCSTSETSVKVPEGKKAVWTRTIMRGHEGYPFKENGRYRIHGYIMDHENEEYSTKTTSYVSIALGEEALYVFNDILEHWAQVYIQKLADRGVITGYEDGSYHPDEQINRAEMVKLAMLAGGYDLDLSVDDEAFLFDDLDEWQVAPVYQAWKNEIVQGYSETEFAPSQKVTRAEALKIALLTFNAEVTELGEDLPFDDIEGHWGATYINEAYLRSVVEGHADGNFYPNDPITRAEAAKIISNLIEL